MKLLPNPFEPEPASTGDVLNLALFLGVTTGAVERDPDTGALRLADNDRGRRVRAALAPERVSIVDVVRTGAPGG